MLVDSHCHLDRLDLTPYNGDISAAIAAATERGVEKILCIGIDRSNAATVVGLADQFEQVWASVGIHPLDLADEVESIEALKSLADHPRVVALGETGLDYYYSAERAEAQQQSFVVHLEAAKQLQKPVVVHTRQAKEDTLRLIRDHGDLEVGGVLHCFTEDWDMASRALDLNYYISFSGIVTFKNAEELRDVAKRVPVDRMLVETDAPYLAPVPYRGKKNEPKYVREVAEFIAELRGVSAEQLIEHTGENFHRLFREAV